MSVVVKNNSVQSSARKVRAVCDLVRDKYVKDALVILRFCEKKSLAITLTKLINSAISIAERDESCDINNLVISSIFADEGPTLKRIRPRAQGRAYRVRYRSSYVTLELQEA